MPQRDADTSRIHVAQLRRARLRSLTQLTLDGLIWPLAVIAAVLLRFELEVELVRWPITIAVGVIAGITHVLIGLLLGLYRGKFRYGTFEELRALIATTVIVAVAMTGFVTILTPAYGVPRSATVIAAPISLILMFGVRYLTRTSNERSMKPSDDAEPALIVGAGHAGEMIVRTMVTDPNSLLRPVGLLDDDLGKKRLQLHGVPVLGRTDEIVHFAAQTGAEALVIAIASADAQLLRRLSDDAERAGLRVLVTPSVQDLPAGLVSASDLRSIDIEDLLGRHPVNTGVESIAGYVTGRRVLVTGAGGSIGSELCRQLQKFGPKELLMLDRDETALQETQIAISGHGLLNTHDTILADIREPDALQRVFEAHRPEVVFHAAALKHLPMLERYPEEAWKTNVLGTLNVVNAARSVGVERFVNISTDKAANPTSALGHSKRVAEKITAWAGEETGKLYLSVRFGNVIGSRGSMLPTFQRLIESGGPLTVTHPDATRYFMTIPEACQLVVQAGGIGRSGEVLILDMGQPVRILDVARRMIAMSGKNIEIVFTGLREGEKLHEELVGDHEHLDRPFHSQISHTLVDSITPERLDLDVWLARMAGDAR